MLHCIGFHWFSMYPGDLDILIIIEINLEGKITPRTFALRFKKRVVFRSY